MRDATSRDKGNLAGGQECSPSLFQESSGLRTLWPGCLRTWGSRQGRSRRGLVVDCVQRNGSRLPVPGRPVGKMDGAAQGGAAEGFQRIGESSTRSRLVECQEAFENGFVG